MRSTRGVRAAHQFLTFATASPLQHAAAVALQQGAPYLAELVNQYRASRAFLSQVLHDAGFDVYQPSGSYFIMADISRLLTRLGPRFNLKDDVTFCRWLTTELKVTAIPPSVFFDTPAHGATLVRFAFCKKQETLDAAALRLRTLVSM
jgi:aspartate/methionine/tyrosine aminotransferase